MTLHTKHAFAHLTLEQATCRKMLLAFDGYELPPRLTDLLANYQIGGVTLFRARNVRDPAQVRSLNAALQRVAAESGQPPLLVGADQEGGQLLALAGTTTFPGNMALGATRSAELARKVGIATGRELAAMGITVNYAPVCDVNLNPRNPVIGTRSFGEGPALVSELAAAMVEGLQNAGVAATAKHFPGHGDTSTDSHLGTPVMPFGLERLRQVELPPFSAAIQAGVKLVMTGHIALPALNDGLELPATLSPAVLKGLLRDELGFGGVVVSDAMDMGAIAEGTGLLVDSIAATAAGVDLLLLTDSDRGFETVYAAVLHAARRGLLAASEVMASAQRVLALKEWVAAQEQPDLEVVGCREHLDLAYEVAARSVTLVSDREGYLPLNLRPEARVLAVVPRPADLTPADTSSYERVDLAGALRLHHPNVRQVDISLDPAEDEIAAVLEQAAGYDLVIVATINAQAFAGQAALVRSLLEHGARVIAVALRLPYDIGAYPGAPAYVCTYSLQPPSLAALSDALFGRIPFQGRLPVSAEYRVPSTE
jgi:beta-N-acetylhexosaminidase